MYWRLNRLRSKLVPKTEKIRKNRHTTQKSIEPELHSDDALLFEDNSDESIPNFENDAKERRIYNNLSAIKDIFAKYPYNRK